jgi:hypothetical protein
VGTKLQHHAINSSHTCVAAACRRLKPVKGLPLPARPCRCRMRWRRCAAPSTPRWRRRASGTGASCAAATTPPPSPTWTSSRSTCSCWPARGGPLTSPGTCPARLRSTSVLCCSMGVRACPAEHAGTPPTHPSHPLVPPAGRSWPLHGTACPTASPS